MPQTYTSSACVSSPGGGTSARRAVGKGAPASRATLLTEAVPGAGAGSVKHPGAARRFGSRLQDLVGVDGSDAVVSWPAGAGTPPYLCVGLAAS